jgi:hypothetical protein
VSSCSRLFLDEPLGGSEEIAVNLASSPNRNSSLRRWYVLVRSPNMDRSKMELKI